MIFQMQIEKNSFNQKLKLACQWPGWPCSANASLSRAFGHHISFATVPAANFGCDLFEFMSKMDSKLLSTAIWISNAPRLESEQTLCSWIGHLSGSATLQSKLQLPPSIAFWNSLQDSELWADGLQLLKDGLKLEPNSLANELYWCNRHPFKVAPVFPDATIVLAHPFFSLTCTLLPQKWQRRTG